MLKQVVTRGDIPWSMATTVKLAGLPSDIHIITPDLENNDFEGCVRPHASLSVDTD